MEKSYLDLVPKKRRVSKTEYPGNLMDEEYNLALTNHKPLYAYVEKLEKALDEIAICGVASGTDFYSKPIQAILKIAQQARIDKK